MKFIFILVVWQVITFSTVEDFWALYNHIEGAAKLNTGCDYSLFKEGIKPMWEDQHNEQGGKWLLQLAKHQRITNLDGIWLEIMMCLIGEAFGEHGSIVNGAVVNIRGKVIQLFVYNILFVYKSKICFVWKLKPESSRLARFFFVKHRYQI